MSDEDDFPWYRPKKQFRAPGEWKRDTLPNLAEALSDPAFEVVRCNTRKASWIARTWRRLLQKLLHLGRRP